MSVSKNIKTELGKHSLLETSLAVQAQSMKSDVHIIFPNVRCSNLKEQNYS